MKKKTTDNRKVLIALILVMVIICGILTGAIFVIVRNKRIVTDEELVTDAFTQMKKDGDSEYCFHIPKINKKSEKIEEINKEIYDTLYKEYSPDDKSAMHYEWATKGNTLSIVVEKENIDEEKPDFFVFNVDIKDEEALSVSDMCGVFGLSEDEFYDKSRDAVEKYSEREKQYFSKEDQEAYINEVIDSTLSDSSIKEALPFIDENEKLCIIVPAFTPGTRDTYLHMIEFDTGAAKENIGCDKSHDNTSTVIITEGATAEETTEAVTEPSTDKQENDEWKDILTKYYWDGSVQSNTIYRFFEDGTYIEYWYPGSFDTEFYPELLEAPSEGTYEIKDNKLFRYSNHSGETFCTEYEWLKTDSDKILDTWIKNRCKDAGYILYDTSWRPDSVPFDGDNSSYLKKTAWVTDENHYKTDASESEEAKTYTDFLQNGGLEEFNLYKNCYNYDHYDTYELSNLDFRTCLYDFDSDGTKELYMTIQNSRFPDKEAQALYTIKNGKVETLLLAEKEFATAGYVRLNLKYDSTKQIPVIEKYHIMKDSSAATYSSSIQDVFTAENGFSEPVVSYESTWLQLNNSYYTEDIAKIKAQTDLYHIGETHFEFYEIDGEFVEKSEFEKYNSRYTDSLPAGLTLRDGTHKMPIK